MAFTKHGVWTSETIDENKQQADFLEHLNHCSICNAELDVAVEPYHSEDLVKEEAHCPQCGFKARLKIHKVQ